MKYKYYRNLLCTTLKKGKQNYFEKFFQNNLNDIKNIWKGIRNFISLKQSPNSNIYLLPYNSETITTNIFYDYFSTISKKTKTKNNFSNKSFADFLHHPIDNFFFITAINSDEIKNRISKLNEYKYTGPNSSPTKILKLLKIWYFLTIGWHIWYLFLFWYFPLSLKIAKIIPIHLKKIKTDMF